MNKIIFRQLFLISLIGLLISGCGNSSDNSARAEVDKKPGSTSTELLAQAEKRLANKSWLGAKQSAQQIIRQHPNSPEANRAKEIANIAQSHLAEIREAQQKANEAQKTKLISSLKSLRKNTDKVEGITWYSDKSSPRSNAQNAFYLYIGEQGNNQWLRLKAQYYADSWLFIHSFTVVADDKKFERNGVKFSKDNYTEIWEWYDEGVTERDIEMIKAVANSKKATIRYYGNQYHDDRAITDTQKKALLNVLNAYEALKMGAKL